MVVRFTRHDISVFVCTEGELRGLAGQLKLGPEASGTYINPHLLPLDHHGLFVGVGIPLSVGAALGMADVMPELERLATYITFTWHLFPFDLN